MNCSPEELAQVLARVKDQVFLPEQGKRLISFIDLTSLNEDDNAAVIDELCRKAVTPYGEVAAICVYPRFVKQAATFLKDSQIKIATVANFPTGSQALDTVLQEIEQALKDGADEIDVVFPYQAFLRGEKEAARHFISQCKAGCQSVTLKVILETGAIQDLSQVAEAATIAILAGADFVKTSTGKIAQGASLEAAAAMMLAIKNTAQKVNRPLGFKAAGGIREPQQALQYLTLAQQILGHVTPNTFRIGASSLLAKL